ncbi:MAG TPA: EamA family transporter [Chloroflexota bacterium]|nr:EamA family transporter [Chloroflexota bacterium]
MMETRVAVVGLSLLAAFLLAGTGIVTKLGLKRSDVQRSVVVCFGANVLVLSVTLLLTRPPLALAPTSAGLFVLDGALGLFAVSLLFVGVDRVGPAISYPIKSASPIAALVFAALFLREVAAPIVYVGAVLAVAGVVLLSAQRTAGGVRWQPAVLFPVGGALFFAADNVVRKAALHGVPSPLVGVTIAIATSFLLALVTHLVLSPPGKRRVLDAGTPYFAAAGALQAAALLAVYAALSMGMVAVVVPLYTSSPLFVLPLSALFLRGVERVTPRIVLGAVAVVVGVVLVALY